MSQNLPRTNGKLDAYAWPGGYPIYYVSRTNDILCPKCANMREADETTDAKDRPSMADVNYENPDLYCDECQERIESAYAEDDAPGVNPADDISQGDE